MVLKFHFFPGSLPNLEGWVAMGPWVLSCVSHVSLGELLSTGLGVAAGGGVGESGLTCSPHSTFFMLGKANDRDGTLGLEHGPPVLYH